MVNIAMAISLLQVSREDLAGFMTLTRTSSVAGPYFVIPLFLVAAAAKASSLSPRGDFIMPKAELTLCIAVYQLWLFRVTRPSLTESSTKPTATSAGLDFCSFLNLSNKVLFIVAIAAIRPCTNRERAVAFWLATLTYLNFAYHLRSRGNNDGRGNLLRQSLAGDRRLLSGFRWRRGFLFSGRGHGPWWRLHVLFVVFDVTESFKCFHRHVSQLHADKVIGIGRRDGSGNVCRDLGGGNYGSETVDLP